MSRSKEETREKIAHKYFSWDSETGQLKYFNKKVTDDEHPKGTNVMVKLPFTFVPLDVLATIKGWNDPSGSAIFSNEVKDISKQEFIVKTFKNGEFATGLYANIKDKIAAKGGKFGNSLYIGYYEGDELVIGNIQIVGASLGGWIDYCKEHPRFKDEGAVKITGFTNEKKGATKYTKPIFEYTPLSPETNALAVALDVELQLHLEKYFAAIYNKNATDKIVDASLEATTEETNGIKPNKNVESESHVVGSDDLPF